jgi:glycosyltransferase involved in cell wall biosynthesis
MVEIGMKPLRLLAIIEASTVTGPAKNLLQFAQLARTAEDDPVEVTIATFHRPGDPEIFTEAAARAGVTVHRIEERGRLDRSVVPALQELSRRLSPDLVQTHAVKSHLLARLAGLKPWIAFHHGYTWPDLRARVYNQADRWSLRKATGVLTVSQPFAEELTRIGVQRERIHIIHNAIDRGWGSGNRAEAARLRTSLGIGAEKRVVLIVGRLSREKNHLTLLDAVLELPEVHLLIVGEGPERVRIEEHIRVTGKEVSVTLTGQVPSAEPYYPMADVAVLSSLSEGSPNALLEAMAAGIPVVATSVGGIPEMVTHEESALLVPPGDRKAMTVALQRLLREEGLAGRLVMRARELVETKHSPEVRTRQICRIYRNLLAKEGAGATKG